MKKILLLALASTALFSCKSLQKTSTAKTLDIIGAGIIHMPVVADLDVRDTKVSGSKSGTTGTSLELMKMESVAAAIKAGSADVLVEPAYLIETEGTRVTVTVTGFPANYKNFRKMTTSDTSLVKPFFIQRPVTVDPVPVKKKRRGAAVAAGIGAAAAITTGLILNADNF